MIMIDDNWWSIISTIIAPPMLVELVLRNLAAADVSLVAHTSFVAKRPLNRSTDAGMINRIKIRRQHVPWIQPPCVDVLKEVGLIVILKAKAKGSVLDMN